MQRGAQALSRDRSHSLRLRLLRKSHLPAEGDCVCEKLDFAEDLVLRDPPSGLCRARDYREKNSTRNRRHLQDSMANVAACPPVGRQSTDTIGAIGEGNQCHRYFENSAGWQCGAHSAAGDRCNDRCRMKKHGNTSDSRKSANAAAGKLFRCGESEWMASEKMTQKGDCWFGRFRCRGSSRVVMLCDTRLTDLLQHGDGNL